MYFNEMSSNEIRKTSTTISDNRTDINYFTGRVCIL